MSIKTLRKRIALVAVSAMGFGLLTTTGASAVGFTDDSAISSSQTCLGSPSDNDNGWYVPVGAIIEVDADTTAFVQVSGTNLAATFIGTGAGTANVSINSKGLLEYEANGDTVFKFVATAAGTAKIIVSTATATTATAANSDSIIVGPCTGATYSAKYSNIQVQEVANPAPDKTIADDLTAAAGNDLYINMSILNDYETGVVSDVWTATATNGAAVVIGAPADMAAAGTLPFDSYTGDGDTVHVRVTPKDAAVASTTTVTVTYKGSVITTKELKFLGEATKITVIANTVGESGSSGMAWYTLQDAAGNQVPGDIGIDTTTLGTVITNVQKVTDVDPDGGTSGATAIGTAGFNTTVLDATSPVKYGIVKFTCAATGTSGTATLVHTNVVSGDDITLPVTFKCAGGVDTYSISLDKASYKVGEVGTLTVTAKDKSGNPVNDFSLVGANGNIALGGGASFVKSPEATDFYGILSASATGVRTYKVQFTTAGVYNVVALMSGTTTKTATAAYTVTSDGVSNAEVLAAIVKLIASISKQIKLLQKQLKKK